MQIRAITQLRGITFHQHACALEPEHAFCFVSATKQQNRKMQKNKNRRGRKGEEEKRAGRRERAFTAVVRQFPLIGGLAVLPVL